MVKGHFGQCKAALIPELNPKKTYDGSKKGSSCLLYRASIEIPNNVIIVKAVKHNPLIDEYNHKVSRNQGFVRDGKPNLHDENKVKDQIHRHTHIHNLPYRVTTDIKKPKSIVYRSRTPAFIIDYALDQMETQDNLMGIVKQIKKRYGYVVTYKGVEEWVRKFKPYLLDKFVKRKLVIKKINGYVTSFSKTIFYTCVCGTSEDEWIKCGFRKNKCGKVQKYKCSKCNRKFCQNIGLKRMKHPLKAIITMIEQTMLGRSDQQISNYIHQNLRIKISRHSVMNWRKEINDDMVDDLSARKILFGRLS